MNWILRNPISKITKPITLNIEFLSLISIWMEIFGLHHPNLVFFYSILAVKLGICFVRDPDNRFSISPNITYINGLFCDTFGEIWFGTNGGIQRFAHKKQKFTLFDHQFFGLLEKLGLSINSAYEDPKGILWITSDIRIIT